MSGPLALPLDLQGICTAFSAPVTTPLLSLLKGGAYVPANTPGGTIPAAPPIAMTDFVGARPVAKLALDASAIGSPVNGLSITSAVLNGAGTLLTALLGGTFSNAHQNFAGMQGSLLLTIRVDAIDTLTAVTIELPPGQTIDPDGYYELYGATQFRSTVTPAGGLTPTQVLPGGGAPPDYKDSSDPYTGNLSIGQPTARPPTHDNAPIALAVQPGNKFVLGFPYLHQMVAGSGSASKSWQSSNGGLNCYIEFPIRIKIYDSAGLNLTIDTIFHIEANTTVGFTLP